MQQMRAIPERERDFQRAIVELARACGWSVYHTYDSRRSTPGFPDLVLAKADRPLIFAEVKTATGQLTLEQERWLELLGSTTSLTVQMVWRPADWPTIERWLKA